MTDRIGIELSVNGRPRSVDVLRHHTLLDVLREDLRLTGTKECCLVGECGACTVLVDGQSVDSCLMLAAEADGARDHDRRRPCGQTASSAALQQAFLDTGAAQCGFCIPGQLVSAHALLATTPHPTRAEVEEGLAGNLCRCAGYEQIIEAVLAAAAGEEHETAHATPSVGDRSAVPDAERGAAVSVGEPAARVGGRARVTGEQQYVADLPHDDALHVKLVALDVARARIGRIDTTAALAVPGVRLVMTPADLPDPMPRFGPQRRDRPVLATGETKYHGEPVAAVAAETLDAAEEAAALVSVEFEELPALHTIEQAPRPGRAARPGPVAPTGRPVRQDKRPPRAPPRLGRRRRGGHGRGGRRRGHIRASRWSPSSRSSRTP